MFFESIWGQIPSDQWLRGAPDEKVHFVLLKDLVNKKRRLPTCDIVSGCSSESSLRVACLAEEPVMFNKLIRWRFFKASWSTWSWHGESLCRSISTISRLRRTIFCQLYTPEKSDSVVTQLLIHWYWASFGGVAGLVHTVLKWLQHVSKTHTLLFVLGETSLKLGISNFIASNNDRTVNAKSQAARLHSGSEGWWIVATIYSMGFSAGWRLTLKEMFPALLKGFLWFPGWVYQFSSDKNISPSTCKSAGTLEMGQIRQMSLRPSKWRWITCQQPRTFAQKVRVKHATNWRAFGAPVAPYCKWSGQSFIPSTATNIGLWLVPISVYPLQHPSHQTPTVGSLSFKAFQVKNSCCALDTQFGVSASDFGEMDVIWWESSQKMRHLHFGSFWFLALKWGWLFEK